ncbi:MAG TPA: response regulator [Longimicrobiales bacterium]
MPQEVVLVVDDNPDQMAIASALLEHAGFVVLQASGAAAADALLDQHCPQLILLDLNMPEKSGLDWLRELAGRECAADMRIAAYTSFGDVYDGQLRAMGVRAVIDKGGTPRQFIEGIREALQSPPIGARAQSS